MIRKHFLPILLTLIIGVIAFRLSLELSLFGDDWLVLYIFKYQVPNWHSYFSPYGPTYLVMGIIDKFFGLNPLPYFVISLITRSLAAIALYALVYYLANNRLSAFAASAFWAVSEIGIESTNWVFNMNSYIGLSLFLTMVIFILKYHKTSRKLFLVISVLLLLMSVIAVPVRMHGAFIVLVLIEVYYLFTKWQGLRSLGKFLLVNAIWVGSFIVLSNWGVFGSSTSNYDTYIGKGIKENAEAMATGRYDHFLLPFTTIGNMFFTDQHMNGVNIPRVIFKTENLSWMKSFLTPIWIAFSLVLSIVSLLLVDRGKRKLFSVLISGSILIMTFLINSFVRTNLNLFSPNQIFLTLSGWAFISFTTLLAFFTKQIDVKRGLLLGLFWLGGFAAIPIIFTPLSSVPTSMRYLVLPGVAIPIVIGLLFALVKSNAQKVLLALLVLPLYLIQYSSTQSYFKNLLVSRSEKISQAVWQSVLSQLPSMDKKQDYLFYFEPKNGNDSVVRDVITFGFIPRMIVYGKSPDRPGSLYVIEKREEFVSAVNDGEKLKAYNWGLPKKIDRDKAFAFTLESDYSLTDIKREILNDTR